MIVLFGSDLITGLTIADFHPLLNYCVFSGRFIILVRMGMQCLRTSFSSLVVIVSDSHDFVGILIMSLYRLVFDIAVKLSSLAHFEFWHGKYVKTWIVLLIFVTCWGRTVQILLLGLCLIWMLVENYGPCFLLVHWLVWIALLESVEFCLTNWCRQWIFLSLSMLMYLFLLHLYACQWLSSLYLNHLHSLFLSIFCFCFSSSLYHGMV